MVVVQDGAERQQIGVSLAVDIIHQRNESHAKRGENLLGVTAGTNVIASQPG
jgi:hypothetical protein